ncbi:putative transposase [Shigella boydii 3594-74]|uniref:IS1 encoded protein n=3 Tax=Shigella boydii TaxID=621 RepID=Q31SV3_SHIBS|nr:putative IS1 encoded protein [Shigella boydii Sb227]EGI95391.1 putative transposase [Shigella boydii 3594-74]
MPCFTVMRAEIALMSGSAFAVTHHAFSSGAGRTSDGNGSHASTLKSPSYTKSVSWQHYPRIYSFMFSRHPGRAYQQLWWTTINFCHFAFDV